jgi:hypothetical protein
MIGGGQRGGQGGGPGLQRDYGWQGRLGLGTPQGNPTAEAEMRRLVPPGVSTSRCAW